MKKILEQLIMNVQMSEVMMSSPHFFSTYFVYKILQISNVLLKHVKACPHIKIYQSKHYFAFIQRR